MHFLVVDGSRVLPSLVARVSPVEAEVATAKSFDEATERLREHPPDALIVNLTPIDLPWKRLLEQCREHSPPIPVLVESCVYRTADEAGIRGLGEGVTFLAKPYGLSELRYQIARLARQTDGVPGDAAAARPAD